MYSESNKFTIFQEFARLRWPNTVHQNRVLAGEIKQNLNNTLRKVRHAHSLQNGSQS